MNIKQLRAFREVMLTGSVSEAARNLYRTQPAISSLIAGLEEELGCDLFMRRNGRLHPVPEAHYLFEEAGEILSKLDMTEQNIKSLRDLESGSLRIVCMPGPSVFLLPDLISKFVEGRDGVAVQLVTRSSPQVFQLMSTQYFDIGLADLVMTGAVDSALTKQQSFPCDCLCAMPKNSPLAELETVTATDLSNAPLAVLQSEHQTHKALLNEFRRVGAEFNVRFETQYFLPLFTFLERGLACSVVDPLSAKSYQLYQPDSDLIVFRPFAPTILHTVSLITPTQRPLSNLAQAFHSTLHSEIGSVRNEYLLSSL